MIKSTGKLLFIVCALFASSVYASLHEEICELTNRAEKNLEASLEKSSISQSLAFKELYGRWPKRGVPVSKKITGSEALSIARFLSGENRGCTLKLTEDQLSQIEELAAHFPTKKLKVPWDSIGQYDSLLPDNDAPFDLSQVLISLRDDLTLDEKRSAYAALDLVALQVEALLKEDAGAKERIAALSQMVFFELKLRFPPQKVATPEIDRYTDIVSVVQSRRGVCLGVSALYLCLAQRLGVDLEIITPPGHIYLKHEGMNIETTARGLDLPDDAHTSIQTKSLQRRTLKEVPGLVLVNSASVSLHKKAYLTAIELYEKAEVFLPNDPTLLELKGIASLLAGKTEHAHLFLKAALEVPSTYAFASAGFAKDILGKRCGHEALEALLVLDENESPLEQAHRIEKALETAPEFAAGKRTLALAYLAGGAKLKAKTALETCLSLSPNDPSIPYQLAWLAIDEYQYDRAFAYLEKAEKIVGDEKAPSKALWNLRLELLKRKPQPSKESNSSTL